MKKFREEYSFLVYYVNGFGLYMKSIESLTTNRYLLAFLAVWTKISLIIIPVYILFDIRFLIYEEAPVLVKFAITRKITAFTGVVSKIIIYHIYRNKIEELIDLWDESFQEEFYLEAQQIYRAKNLKRNKTLIRGSLLLLFSAALFYSLPEYFSKTKVLMHPSGIVYPHRSPEYEIVVTYEVLVAVAAVSKVGLDSIVIVLLSQVRTQLAFLRDTLAHMVNELVIDNEGRLMSRRPEDNPNMGDPLDLLVANENISEENGFKMGLYEEIEPKSENFDNNVKEFEAKLRIWIMHHQQTIRFFEELRKVYSPVGTFELMYVITYIGLTALYLLQVKPSPVILGVAGVASSNLLILFLVCKIGAEIGETNAFGDAFGRAWFLFPKKIKTAFSVIVMRCKKPLTLYGLSIYSMNLVMFFEILKLAYQLFAFMVQFTE